MASVQVAAAAVEQLQLKVRLWGPCQQTHASRHAWAAGGPTESDAARASPAQVMNCPNAYKNICRDVQDSARLAHARMQDVRGQGGEIPPCTWRTTLSSPPWVLPRSLPLLLPLSPPFSLQALVMRVVAPSVLVHAGFALRQAARQAQLHVRMENGMEGGNLDQEDEGVGGEE